MQMNGSQVPLKKTLNIQKQKKNQLAPPVHGTDKDFSKNL